MFTNKTFSTVLIVLPVFVIPELFFQDPVGKDWRTDNAFEFELVGFDVAACSPGDTRIPVPVNETIFRRLRRLSTTSTSFDDFNVCR